MVGIESYLDALKALEFILKEFGEAHWKDAITRDINAWVHRKEAKQHQGHYGGMGSFNDTVLWFPENFSTMKRAGFNQYYNDLRTITYTLAGRHGKPLSYIDMEKQFGNFGMQMRVYHCVKCNIYDTPVYVIESFAAQHYAHQQILEHYKDTSLFKLVNDRVEHSFEDFEEKVNYINVLVTEAGISINESKKYSGNCPKCGNSHTDLTSWILSDDGKELKELGKDDFTLSQNIRDVFK